jgi:hypothetical protein
VERAHVGSVQIVSDAPVDQALRALLCVMVRLRLCKHCAFPLGCAHSLCGPSSLFTLCPLGLHRYRWGETNAGMNWKERGRGDMKLQRNGNSRLLMRRPETKKICCNQVITPDINIEYYKGQDNFLQWTALDFSGDEGSDPTRPYVTPSCTRLLWVAFVLSCSAAGKAEQPSTTLHSHWPSMITHHFRTILL